MSDRRRAARNLITIVILVLIPASLYLIVEQPNFTPGMARFRVEYEYGVRLTQVSEVKLDLDRDRSGWNEAQQFGALAYAEDAVCMFGRVGKDYALIAADRHKGELWWDELWYCRLRPQEGVPVVSSHEWGLYEGGTKLIQGIQRGDMVFGAVLDPDITRVELTYPQSMENRVCTVETTEFYDGMFLLYLGDWQYDHYILSAYDAAGELVYRDTRWGADQGWIEETYISHTTWNR